MHKTSSWYSPYPLIQRGSAVTVEDLANLDKDVQYLESICSDLKEKRKQYRATNPADSNVGFATENLHSDYLSIVENQRRVECELSKLREERLHLVLLADLAFDPLKRGENFPHSSAEEQAKQFIETQKDRLLVVSTVAFFGSGITFSTIFSGARGSVGLMSISWAAFATSFSLCVFSQWLSPLNPESIVLAYPRRRNSHFGFIFLAAFASFVGIALMGLTVATLDLRKGGSASQVDTRINTLWGGIISLLPVLGGFFYGCGNLAYNGVQTGRIGAQRVREGNP